MRSGFLTKVFYIHQLENIDKKKMGIIYQSGGHRQQTASNT